MKHHRGWGFRGAVRAAAAIIVVSAGAAHAQTPAGTGSGGVDLRRQLSELAANPTSVQELIGTGRAALAVGDGEAALGFFARANELSPRDPRVKAGLAAANARTGRPETALVLFSEAVALGAPEGEIAGERGLAYDLLGQPARAQQDYVLSLRHRDDPEVRRRMALSLAISGQREPALRLLDEQVRQGDRAGNRARVMVLALSGDVRGATAAAQASLPPGAAQAITPFFSRLASLSPAQMASAANLGRVPTAGGVNRMASSGSGARVADPGALAFAGGGASTAPSIRSRLPIAPAQSTAPRRRPGTIETAARAATPMASTVRIRQPGQAQPSSARPSSTQPSLAQAAPVRSSPTQSAPVQSQILASSVLDSGRPRGSWSGSTVTAALSAPITQPHPHQPISGLVASAPASPAPGATTGRGGGGDEDVVLAGASDQPRLPDAVLPGPGSDPVLSGTAAADDPAPAVAGEPVPAQIASVQPQEGPPEPAPAADREIVREEAPASTLAVWNSGAIPATPAPTTSALPRPGFSDVVATISSLPTETPLAPAAARPQRTAIAARSTTARPAGQSGARTGPTNAASRGAAANRTGAPVQRARTPQQAHPSRVWVQLGVSQSRSGFTYEINRMRRAAPELLQNRTPHVAPIGSSHRLLVGPFPSEAAARTFINGLRQKNIQSLAWTSPAGTEVERFTGGR